MSEEGIKEVRRVRHEISEERNHDVDSLVAFYQSMEQDLRASGEFRFADDRSKRHTVPQEESSSR